MHKQVKAVAFTLAAASLVAGALAGCASGSATSNSGVGPITFASGKDLTGAMPQLLAQWNKLHPDQKVTFIELSASPDDQRNSFVQDLQAKSDKYDVMWDDVVWTSEFAAHGWLAQLDKSKVGGSDVLPAAVNTATYNGKMYGAPFMTNAQLLYFRSDLIAEAADDMEGDASGLRDRHRARHDLLRGRTVRPVRGPDGERRRRRSTRPAVRSSALTGKTVTVDSPEARAGLQHLVDLFKKGDVKPAAITYQEQQSADAFLSGKSLFLTNWPYVYTAASDNDIGDRRQVRDDDPSR